jgi:hypothetical protein
MKTIITFSILIAIILGGVAVAEKKPIPQAPTRDKMLEHSGFLGNYDDFKIINPETNAEVWIKPPHQDLSLLKEYKAVVFSPIEIWMHSASDYQGIDPNELKLITDYFLEKLQQNLGKNFEIVEEPGPNVMHMRIAITGVQKVKPHKEVYDFIPVKLIWDAGNAVYRKKTGKHLDAYQASLEMEIRDSQSGQRLVAAIDKHSVEATTEEGEDTWAPLEKVLDYWANIISDRLARAQVK